MTTLELYIRILIVCSSVTFVLYVIDKIQAIKFGFRVPEKILLLLSFCGGAIGGTLAMKLVRHKTRKITFRFINFVGLIWQIAVLIFLINNPNYLF